MWAQRMGINVYHGIDVAFQIRSLDEIKIATTTNAWKLPTLGWQSPKPKESFATPRVQLKDSSGTIGSEVKIHLWIY
jgi:hypothetical protein